ncbi:MAG: radical SAM protein [Thermodesulfobacteriota bacterium]
MSLKVCEIFASIQGESSYAGLPMTFVRLGGCNLRCRYCDTPQAQDGGEEMRLDDVVQRVLAHGWKLVEITGGEPLMQEKTPDLARALQSKGRTVLVETNGSLDISVLPPGVIRVMDIKCPSSGESEHVLWQNLWKLEPYDEVKFVLANRHDYEWTKGILRERFGANQSKILFSAVFGELPPRVLAEWMLTDKVQARLQLQMHKFIWPPGTKGV